MLRRSAAAALACVLLATATLPAAAPPPHPALARGLALLREGDFEAAVIELDAAVRRLEGDPAASAHVPWGYVHLGVAYLELDQEMVARGKFQEALARDPALRLDAAEFSAQQVRVFESVRAEASAAPPVEPARPTPRATPSPRVEEKGSSRTLLLVLGGGAAAAGAAVALGGGGGGGGGSATTTTTTPVGGGPSTTVPSPSPSPSEPPPTTAPPTTTPPTTTPPTTTPSCTYAVNGPNPPNPYPQVLASGSCTVQTQSGCRWTPRTNDAWISVSGGGSGPGQLQFTLAANSAPDRRNGTIFLEEAGGAACPIEQRGLVSVR